MGGVRGVVVGDVIRRLVSRTMAQQMSAAVESATAPFHYALSTRAGCECIAHALQGLTDVDPSTTIISIDGISAFDQISRAAMLDGLMNVERGGKVVPFVRMFYGSPSSYLWDDASGVTHTIPQGEGGEQGDPLMPLLFSLGQHSALVAIQEDLYDNEFLFALLNDIYVARIRIHGGKTQVWNAVDDKPKFCDVLGQIGQRSDPHARVWRGSALPLDKQGVKILGTPLGHPQFVEAYLCKKTAAQEVLLERIPAIPDLQSSWSLLLHCASARANYLLRVVKPKATRAYPQRHNEGLWKCLCKILHVDPGHCAEAKVAASMPLNLGCMGLRDALRMATPAYWASWADCMPMIFKRHAHVANLFMHELDGAPGRSFGSCSKSPSGSDWSVGI